MMMKPLLSILAASLLVAAPALGQEADWLRTLRQIELLKADRPDIEKKFGAAETSTSPYFRSYVTRLGRITVEYSPGDCAIQQGQGWNVPEFTVTRIFVDFSRPLKPKKLGIRTDGIYRREIEDVPGAFWYEDDASGIRFGTKRDGSVEGVELYPNAKDDLRLSCK